MEPQPKGMLAINKILIKHSVIFYAEAWNHRNEMMHRPEYYKPFVTQWNENVKEMIMSSNRPKMKKYMRIQELNTENGDAAYIRQWILSSIEMFKISSTKNLMIFDNTFQEERDEIRFVSG